MLGFCKSVTANYANGDRRLEQLFSSFIAPCCWRENLSTHASPTADELRAEIRKRVAAGNTDEQIKAAFLSRYSTRILAMPEGAKAQWLNWTPWVLASAGAAAVATMLSRARHTAPGQPSLPELPDSEW